jgi:hypothetical protein
VYKVRVKTESGATADYEITFVRDAGSDDNSIIQYEYLANTGDSSYTNLTVNGVDTSYKYTLPLLILESQLLILMQKSLCQRI